MVDFGKDLDCLTDLTPSMAEVSGLVGLQQALFRRLQTPRGQLHRYRNYGYDLRYLIGKETQDTSSISRGIERELIKDERVKSVTAEVIFVTSKDEVPESFMDLAEELIALGGSLEDTILTRISIRSSEGPFDLTLAAGSVTIQLLGLGKSRTSSSRTT